MTSYAPYFDVESFLKKHLPQYSQNYHIMRKMEKAGERRCQKIVEAMQDFFGKCFLPEIGLELFEGGMTTAINLKVTLRENTYALHFFDLSFSFDPFRNEITCLEAAFAAGIAPRVYYRNVFSDCGVVIMEFLRGRSIQVEELKNRAQLPRLIQTIKTVHALPVSAFPPLPTVLDSLVQDMYFFEMNNLLNPKTHYVHEALQKIQHQMADMPIIVAASHWDLNPRNIFMQQERPVLIDWGLSRLENPFYDLGYFSLVSSLNEEEEEAMLTVYLEEAARDRDRAFLFFYKSLACARIGTNFYKQYLLSGERQLKGDSLLSAIDLIKLHAFEQHKGTKELTEEIILAAYNQFLKNAYSEKMQATLNCLIHKTRSGDHTL